MPTWQYQLSYLSKAEFQIKCNKAILPTHLRKKMPWERYDQVLEELLRTGKDVQEVPEYVKFAMKFKRKDSLDDFSSQSIECLQNACPFWDKLYAHQKVGVAKCVIQYRGNSLIADEMGAGKSYTALASAKILLHRTNGAQMLILSPAFLVKQWERYASEYLDTISVKCFSYDKAKNIHKELKKQKWNLVLCDESHCLKDTKTKRFKKLGALIRKTKFKLLLSGTPCVNKANELFSPLNLLHPKQFKSYKKYCFRYFDLLARKCRLPEEMQTILPLFGLIRRTKQEVLDLPPKKIQFWYIIDPKAQKSIATLKKKLEKSTDSNLSKYLVGEAFHALALIKAESTQLRDTLKTLILKREQPLVLFCVHLSILELMMQVCSELDLSHEEISGKVSMKQRDKIVENFQNGDIQCLCCTISSAGVGLTLTKSHNVIFCESSWTPGELSQAIDRVHRIGQTHSVNVDRIMFSQSLDEWILKVEKGKQKMHKLLLNKKRK